MRPLSMRRATPDDWQRLADLLATADLPRAGAEAHLSDFFLAFRDDVLIGAAGLERYGDTALLRSVAVAARASDFDRSVEPSFQGLHRRR